MRLNVAFPTLMILALALPAATQPCDAIQTELVVLRLVTDDILTVQADPLTPALQVSQESEGVHAVVGPTGFRYEETEIDFPGGHFPLEALRELMPEGLELLLAPTLVTCPGEPAAMSIGAGPAGSTTSVHVDATTTANGYDLAVRLTQSGPAFNAGIPLNLMRVKQPVTPGEPLLALRQVSSGEWILIYLMAEAAP